MQALLHSAPPALKQATADPHLCQRLLDTNGHVWISLLWGHCTFFLCLGVPQVLFVPSKSLFPQVCVSSGGSMVGIMATSFKRAYAIPKSAANQSPYPCGSPLLTHNSQEMLKYSSVSVSWGLWFLVHTRFV